MPALRKYDQETRDRAVRMYQERRQAHPGESAIESRRQIGALIDVQSETMRGWIERAEVDAGGRGVAAEPLVFGGGAVAQLGHGTENGDPPLARETGQGGECGPHRLGVGVVGVVHHDHAVRTLGDLHPPPRDGPGLFQSLHHPVQVGTQLQRHRRGGQRVADLVLAVHRQAHRGRARGGDQVEGRPAPLVDRDILRRKAELLGSLQRLGGSDPEGSKRLQEQLVELERERRSLRQE